MHIQRHALVEQVFHYIQAIVEKLASWEQFLPWNRPAPRRQSAPPAVQRPMQRPVPAHADERTARRMAEAERGGLSSQESAERYARGENPGGMHHKSVRREVPEHQRPELYEPQERKETVPGKEKHIAVMRRGS
jgi:hypothetical protein